MSSYCSERTVEYMLIPQLVKILEQHFDVVVPIYSLATREFTKLSRSLHSGESFQVLALFPRRPKLTGKGECDITVNYGLDHFQDITESYGIPVILGCTNATNYWELANKDNCIWLNMSLFREEGYITPLKTIMCRYPEAVYTESSLIDLAVKSKYITIDELADIAREGRMVLGHNWYGPRYRPVYVLLKS